MRRTFSLESKHTIEDAVRQADRKPKARGEEEEERTTKGRPPYMLSINRRNSPPGRPTMRAMDHHTRKLPRDESEISIERAAERHRRPLYHPDKSTYSRHDNSSFRNRDNRDNRDNEKDNRKHTKRVPSPLPVYSADRARSRHFRSSHLPEPRHSSTHNVFRASDHDGDEEEEGTYSDGEQMRYKPRHSSSDSAWNSLDGSLVDFRAKQEVGGNRPPAVAATTRLAPEKKGPSDDSTYIVDIGYKMLFFVILIGAIYLVYENFIRCRAPAPQPLIATQPPPKPKTKSKSKSKLKSKSKSKSTGQLQSPTLPPSPSALAAAPPIIYPPPMEPVAARPSTLAPPPAPPIPPIPPIPSIPSTHASVAERKVPEPPRRSEVSSRSATKARKPNPAPPMHYRSPTTPPPILKVPSGPAHQEERITVPTFVRSLFSVG